MITKTEVLNWAWWKQVLAMTILIQVVMLGFDISQGFVPFLHGDRSFDRWHSMGYFLAHAHTGVIPALAHSGVVPGEFLLHLPFYLVAGMAGMVLFQIALFIASLLALGAISTRLFSWRYAPFFCCLAYQLIPQTLAFAHQFVTEGVATSFCILFVFATVRLWESRHLKYAVFAGLMLGLGVFVRPAIVLAVPVMVVLGIWAAFKLHRNLYVGIAIVSAVAIAPLAIWVVLYTGATGHVGYTSGVANLNWNLRSRIYLVQTAHGTPKIPEVAAFPSYPSLYDDPGGVSVSRFLSVASKDPINYVKGALVDQLIVFGKGNTTKLTVDYFGIAGDKGLKDWRNHFERGGISGLAIWAGQNSDVIFVTVLELVVSIFTLPATIIAMIVIGWSIISPATFTRRFGPTALIVAYLVACLLASAAGSALLVDRAQAKLRHPVDAGFILMLGLAISYAYDRWGNSHLRFLNRLRAADKASSGDVAA